MIVPITITLSATADIPVGNMAFMQLTEADTAFVDITGGGLITITDWQTYFAPTITRNQVEANIWVKIAGVWTDLGKVAPAVSFNGADTLLQTAIWTLNTDNIQKIKITLW